MTLADDILRRIGQIETRIVDQVHDVALNTELVGISAMRDRIEAAETNWGRQRQAGMHGAARPSAGRIERGDMYNAVTGETNREGNERIVIQWGWQDPEAYYGYQNDGTKHIEGMDALAQSLHIADDDLVAGVRRIR